MEDCGKALTELILSGGKASLRRVICVIELCEDVSHADLIAFDKI